MSYKNSNPGPARNEAGFSLIELSIVMIIGGTLLAAALGFYQAKIQQTRLDKTNDNRHAIQKAIVDFITDDPLITDDYAGQRYPCPADPDLAPGAANFGVEQTVTANGTCKVVGGIQKVTGVGGDVFIGALPVVTLGLGGNMAYDVYKNKYTYAVSDKVSQFKTMVNADATGSIRILDASGGTMINSAQFIVLSHGKNGSGANALQGGKIACPTKGKDPENCNNDGVFLSMEINEGDEANYYDDYAFMTLGDDVNDGWMQSTDTTQMHIITKNSGNMGVGVSGRAPTEKLEVVGGNIKTDEDVEAGNAMKAKFFYYTD